ncbi:NAD(P)-binding protein [Athelia psychrophila]|uniref:NAD(P)-binding protein n=1 Tax=Athelia psychrophila TaxID=1759441 RepID=A0A167XG32_9AGAM|nr:NAD(P)-binding protein [Fibularhizoctonia sp. CBS 109695]
MSRIVAVFGATGTQGSSVVNALLQDRTFAPRAITRNPSSDAAKALAARGVEVVTGDLWDKESIRKAVAGCEAVFGVTDFGDPSIMQGNARGEIIQGKLLIDAAKDAGVKFFVWSSLPNGTEVSKGKYTGVAQFDGKVEVEEYLKASGLPAATACTGWFVENILKVPGMFAQGADGAYELAIPCYSAASPNALTWAENALGTSVLALLTHYQDRADEILGKTFYVGNADMTYPDFAAVLSKAIDRPVRFVSGPPTGIQPLDDMYKIMSEFGMYPDASLPDPRLIALGAQFATLEEFAEQHFKPRFHSSTK